MVNIKTIYIIGGGIAGLSAGYFARKRFPQAEIKIYEAGKNLGGRCQTFYSKKLDIELDNATHVILKGNKYSRQFLQSNDFINTPFFYDFEKHLTDINRFSHAELILRSIFNTDGKSIDWQCKLKLAQKLFPYLPSQLKIYYSKHSLQKDLILPLCKKTKNIFNNMPLRGIEITANRISKLIFPHKEIKINADDIVISALDAHNYSKIFGGVEFEYNRIVNIFYRTSQKLALPNNADMLGIEHTGFDWLFVTNNTIGVTISNINKNLCCNNDWAIAIWKKICEIRQINPAFIPAFQILDYPRATIIQDKINNRKRPNSAKCEYKNLFLAGDWTMKNWPCCIEAAIASACRAINSI